MDIMKTPKTIHYQIAVSRTYQSTHPRKGEKTYFVEQIKNAILDGLYILKPDGTIITGKKLHTCRTNYKLWVKRMEKVQAGLAVIDLFYWELPGGRFTPGNTKEIFATLDKNSGCGVQELRFSSIRLCEGKETPLSAEIPFSYKYNCDLSLLAKHDGLSIQDFKDWFKSKNLSKALAIIHFTKFRY
jgi:hypothetical protein